jgi:ElaB/YqjD/DUF883 family membrane-anchored ribosome-binding protein
MNQMNEKEENADEIRRDIEDTRQRISSEIEAIEDKLTPGHAKEVVMEKVSDTGHRVANRIEDTAITVRSRASRVRGDFGAAVRANPLPVALVGIGTGWLFWEAFRPMKAELEAEPLFDLDADVEMPSEETVTTEFGVRETDGHRKREIQQRLGETKERVAGLAGGVRERASGARERASHLAYDAKDRASHVAQDAKERATHLANEARERSRRVAERGRDRARRTREAARSTYSENPLVFASIALATGVGLGMMLPRSEREDRTFGPSRERVMTRVRNMAEKAKDIAIDSVREGTNVARETAKREAEEQRLVP